VESIAAVALGAVAAMTARPAQPQVLRAVH